MGRSYVKLDKGLDYDAWCDGIRLGRNYVSEGKSHLLDMKLNDAAMGENGSELRLATPPPPASPATARLTAKVAALLPEQAPEASRSRIPWNIERARIPGTRTVKVEAIVNGQSVAEQTVTADGGLNDVAFDLKLDRSSWVALRIFPSSHSNPIS